MHGQLLRRHIQLLRSLRSARGVRAEGLFVAEGAKLVTAMLQCGHRPVLLFHTDGSAGDMGGVASAVRVSPGEMERLSALPSRAGVVAVFPLPTFSPKPLGGHRSLLLDAVQDPANVGTLIRTAHWFGFDQVVCSPGCALAYAPKAVQASMGAIAGMHVAYADLEPLLRPLAGDVPVVAATLGGERLASPPPAACVLLLGNEGHGLSPQLEALATQRVTLPPVGDPTVDSLNVAAAGAVLCAWVGGCV